jgi:hypothetical protein
MNSRGPAGPRSCWPRKHSIEGEVWRRRCRKRWLPLRFLHQAGGGYNDHLRKLRNGRALLSDAAARQLPQRHATVGLLRLVQAGQGHYKCFSRRCPDPEVDDVCIVLGLCDLDFGVQ